MSRPVCATCGNFEVSIEVVSGYWNAGTQQIDASDACDKGHHCDVCDGEVRLRWVETFTHEVTQEEHATILAALRFWQEMEMYNPNIGSRRSPDCYSIATCNSEEPIDSDDIDDLIARLNA